MRVENDDRDASRVVGLSVVAESPSGRASRSSEVTREA
jgi:hypothetical protein